MAVSLRLYSGILSHITTSTSHIPSFFSSLSGRSSLKLRASSNASRCSVVSSSLRASSYKASFTFPFLLSQTPLNPFTDLLFCRFSLTRGYPSNFLEPVDLCLLQRKQHNEHKSVTKTHALYSGPNSSPTKQQWTPGTRRHAI